MLRLDAERAAIGQLDGSALADVAVRPANLAYILYTSGSTGQPKGVLIEHRQAMSFLSAAARRWQVGPDRRGRSQIAAFTFDVSVLDTFLPLLTGAKVVLVPPQARQSPPRLAALIRQAAVTVMSLPPAMLAALPAVDFPALRVMMIGGEELPSELARQWERPGLLVVNGYGPTEATVLSTWQELDGSYPPPIGWPLPNYRAYVLDPQLNPVPAGVTGELHVGGAGVGRGYLGRPGLTAERFVADPFSAALPGAPAGARLYKTGDLVRRRPDGAIMFLGRIDGQVKIRGLRVELGEIESVLQAHPAVAQAVVTLVPGPAGDQQLAAFVRSTDGGRAEPADLRAYLARGLPDYMIPAHLVRIDEFPLNASGKVDRAALKPPQAGPAGAAAAGHAAGDHGGQHVRLAAQDRPGRRHRHLLRPRRQLAAGDAADQHDGRGTRRGYRRGRPVPGAHPAAARRAAAGPACRGGRRTGRRGRPGQRHSGCTGQRNLTKQGTGVLTRRRRADVTRGRLAGDNGLHADPV